MSLDICFLLHYYIHCVNDLSTVLNAEEKFLAQQETIDMLTVCGSEASSSTVPLVTEKPFPSKVGFQ